MVHQKMRGAENAAVIIDIVVTRVVKRLIHLMILDIIQGLKGKRRDHLEKRVAAGDIQNTVNIDMGILQREILIMVLEKNMEELRTVVDTGTEESLSLSLPQFQRILFQKLIVVHEACPRATYHLKSCD